MPEEKSPKNEKRKIQISRYPFLVKMILTIYLFICIPMIFAQVFILRSSYQKLSTQNDAYCYEETQKLSSYMSSQFSAFRTIALKISTSAQTSVKKYMYTSQPEITAIAASKELSSYLLSLPIADRIGVYYIDRQIFLDDRNYYKLENFCSSFSGGDPALYQRVYSLFTEPFDDNYRMISSLNENKLSGSEALVAIPVRMNNYNNYDAIVYFTVTFSSVNSFLVTPFSDNRTYVIFDKKGDLFFTSSTNGLDELRSQEFTVFLSDEARHKYSFERGDVIAYKWEEDGAPFLFVSLVGRNEIEETSAAFLKSMLILLFVNILLTVILVTVTVYINYNPLRKLVTKLTSHNKSSSASELGLIEAAVTELGSQNQAQSMVIMDYVLNDLLYGTSVRQQQLSDLMPNLNFKYFCAASVTCSQPTTEQSQRISQQISDAVGYQVIITDMPGRDSNFFLFLSRQMIIPEILPRLIEAAVKDVLNEICQASVGTVVDNLNDIPISYYASQPEAVGKSGFAYAKGYPAAEIQLFIRQVEALNFGAARDSLRKIMDFSQKNEKNRALCRYVDYEVLIAYVSARKRTSYPIANPELKTLVSFENTSHLLAELENSMSEIERQLAQTGGGGHDALQNETVEYVNDNFCKTDISLTNVADHFGISIYTLSRLFKQRTGIGFKEYITAKRLELACRLLVTTNDAISAIALKCGFENPTYFSSIFKAHYGMNPSKFRENNP